MPETEKTVRPVAPIAPKPAAEPAPVEEQTAPGEFDHASDGPM